MTKEQEEAIEIINKIIKNYIKADECGLSNNDFKHEIKAMQTVLNILKEKDKEIEKKDKIIDLMTKSIELQQYANIDTTNLDSICSEFKCSKKCNLVKEECIKQYFAGLAEKERI